MERTGSGGVAGEHAAKQRQSGVVRRGEPGGDALGDMARVIAKLWAESQ